ncbi:MAG: HDIG domain-containing protein [Candidatus Omnitrophica bacterium]|nr:HDIG domain-containing protein [Candidatus Omnitrophota bacterium]
MIQKNNQNNVQKKTRKKRWIVLFTVLYFILFGGFCLGAGYSLILPLLLFFLGLYLSFFNKASVKKFLHLGLLLTLIVSTAHVIQIYTEIPEYYVPVAGIAMLTMLLFNDLQLAFIMSLASSVLVRLIVGGDIGMFLTFFIGSLAGAYTVRDARTRGKLISAGLFVSVMNVIAILLLTPNASSLMTTHFAINYLYPAAANGFISAFLVVATLKVFEYLFGVMTNYSLLELSDFNQPLLKRMVYEAPGTYHHSLMVSNLAEAAADSIGANALLTRVGAYYHDIGKMVKSEYFTENQSIGGNKHDTMEPSMSRLVILNHVKEGIELAKKHKLNQKIIDFIPQHHGTSLMYYFYQRALEESEEGEEVNEDDFRYPGPKPQTRETAITLLADSVEGATRALDDPNPTNIEETVKKIVNNKFIDGQLDECPLTLKEIETITNTFIRVLTAMYHGRVKYPEKKNGSSARTEKKQSAARPKNSEQTANEERSSTEDGDQHRKPSDKTSSGPSADQQDYSADS